MIAFIVALALGAVAPLSAGASISAGTIQFVATGGSGAPPTDVNGNGILDAGDFLFVEDDLLVTGSSVARVPVGTTGTLSGLLMIQSSNIVRATVRLSLPSGSFHVVGWFSASVFAGSGERIELMAQGRTGIFSRAQGRLSVAPGETTTYSLSLWPFSYLGWNAAR
jgi:hypothetical protein